MKLSSQPPRHTSTSHLTSLPPRHFLSQNIRAHHDGVDAHQARELKDLHDLLGRRTVPHRISDVQLQAGRVQVRRCAVDGAVDELLHLWGQARRALAVLTGLVLVRRPRPEGVSGEVGVRFEEVRVEPKNLVPRVVCFGGG